MATQLFVRRDRGGVVVLQILERELSDLVLQDRLALALTDFVETHQPRCLLLDLSEVDYCATGVINTFLLVRNRVIELGGEFKLCCPSDPLRLAFRTLNLDQKVFSIHASVAEAIEAFAASAGQND